MSERTIAFGDLLEEVTRPVEIFDDREYACAGVRLHGLGVFIRERKRGVEILKKHVQHAVIAGDIVYSTLFAGKGAFAVADHAVEGAILSEKFPTFRLKDNRVSQQYLAWLFRSGQLSRVAEEQTTGIASFSLSHLSKKKFLALRVPVPSPERQASVVEKCEASLQISLECERPLREDQDILVQLIGALSERLFGAFPRKRLMEVGEYVFRNVKIDPEAEYKQITVAMNNQGLRLRRICKGSEILSPGQCRVEDGDILFSRIDLRNGAIGVVSSDLGGAVVSRDFPVFRLFENRVCARQFLYFVFQTPSFKAQARGASKGTTGRKKMKREQFLSLEVPWPSAQDQERLAREVEAVRAEVTKVRRHLHEQGSAIRALSSSIVSSLFAQDAGLQGGETLSGSCRQ